MKKYIISVCLILSMLMQPVSSLAAISSSYDIPPVNPPANAHPRVLFTAADIPEIAAELENPGEQNASACSMYRYRRDMTENDPHGGGDGSEGHNYKRMANIEAKAFDYAITGNADNGNLAVELLLEYLNTITFGSGETTTSRQAGHIMYVAGEVYDWCYPLIKGTQNATDIISLVENKLASKMEIGWPPRDQGAVTGHGSESQLLRDMLCFAIATYDERPDIWKAVAGRFYEEYVPVREYFNKAHYNLQGDGYGLYRHRWDSWAYLLITGMGAPAPYDAFDLSNVAYSQIYMRRPDGQYMRDGDTYSDADYTSPFEFWSHFSNVYLMDAAIGNDPYLKNEWIRNNKSLQAYYEDSTILQIVLNRDELKPKSIKNLPLSRFFSAPAGIMTARTSWDEGADSNAVVAEMKIGGDVVNNHQHLDAGHFQLYYKGILASDSGMYQGADDASDYEASHHKMYSTKTIAHNSMLVYDPNEASKGIFGFGGVSENRSNCVDGGQKAVNSAQEFSKLPSNATVATVLNQEIDRKNPETPNYTYIKGDLKNAYTSKVSDYKRSFMFLNLGREDVPAALIVLDNITSSNASYKKTWLLHGQEEPTINGNQTVFSRTYADENGAYNGKMTVDTLLPENPSISKVGGEGNWSYVAGAFNKNYEAAETGSPVDEGNTWRMEISPSTSEKTDTFLNVLQVSDNDKNYYLSPEKIDDGTVVGVEIADRVVTFSKSGNEISDTITLSAPGGQTEYTLCDVKPGTWTVSNGASSKTYQATADGKVLNFIDSSADGTAVTVTYTSSTVTEQPVAPEATDITYLDLYVEEEAYETDNTPRLDEEGNPLVAAADAADIIGLTMLRNGSKIVFSKDGSKSEVTPVIIDGEEFVRFDILADAFSAAYRVDETFLKLIITPFVAKEFQIYVSSDGENYTKVDMTKFTATDWIVNKNDGFTYGKWYADSYGDISEMVAYPIKDKTQFVWMYADVPEGADLDIWTGFVMDGGISPLEPWREDPFENNNTYARWKLHQTLPVKVDNNIGESKSNPLVVPLRMGRPGVVFNYKTDADANMEVYGMRLLSGWATAAMSASLENMHDIFYIWSRDGVDTIGMPVMVNGASAANDNQMLLDSYTYARPNGVKKEWNEKTLWVGAHLSKWLEGSSYVMMPIWGLTYAPEKNAEIMADPETKFFDIKTQESYSWTQNYSSKENAGWTEEGAGYDGEVVVLMAEPAAEGSKYLDPSSGWECVNNGTAANGISTKNADFSARDKNSYTNTDYYATAIQWKASSIINGKSSNSITSLSVLEESDNAHRTMTAGIHGSMDGAWNKTSKLTYAYRYKFKAGDSVPIWNPCNITDSEPDSMMVPIIKYYTPEETLDLYVEDGDIVAKGGMKNTTEEEKSGVVIVAQFDDDGRLLKVETTGNKSVEAGTDKLKFFTLEDYAVSGADVVRAYFWKSLDTMKPYLETVEYKLSD